MMYFKCATCKYLVVNEIKWFRIKLKCLSFWKLKNAPFDESINIAQMNNWCPHCAFNPGDTLYPCDTLVQNEQEGEKRPKQHTQTASKCPRQIVWHACVYSILSEPKHLNNLCNPLALWIIIYASLLFWPLLNATHWYTHAESKTPDLKHTEHDNSLASKIETSHHLLIIKHRNKIKEMRAISECKWLK